MNSVCPNGTLLLGFTSENFPTFFQNENTGRFSGINVLFWREFAKRFNCLHVEYVKLSNEDYVCTNRYCPDAVAMGIDRGRVFADADGSVLDPVNVLQHKYSSLSDASKLIFVDARTPLRDSPLSISFYVIFTPEAAVLLLLSFVLTYILNTIHKRNTKRTASSPGVNNVVRTLFNLVSFANRLAQLFIVILLFSYYQSLFNGNAAMELLEPPTQFAALLSNLFNGSERLVVSDGLLMSNEMTSLGPGTTTTEETTDRFHQICSDPHATALFYEDELAEFAFLSTQERLNCRLSRISVNDASRLPLPRLINHFDRGMNFFVLMPRRTPKHVVDSVNRILSVFGTNCKGYYTRKFVPARGIQAATDAVYGVKVDEPVYYFRPLSLYNLFYPLLFLCAGSILSFVSFLIERILFVCVVNSHIETHRVGRQLAAAIGLRPPSGERS